LSPLSLLTFFAAAKKVSAAPHRGNANRPITQLMQINQTDHQNKKPNQTNTPNPNHKKKQKNRKTENSQTEAPQGQTHISPHNTKKHQNKNANPTPTQTTKNSTFPHLTPTSKTPTSPRTTHKNIFRYSRHFPAARRAKKEP
jgi:hypothetical protein